MRFICLFLPSVFSLVIHKKNFLTDKLLDNILIYFMYNFAINLIMCIFLNYFSVNNFNIFSDYLFSINFSMKYMLLSLFISIVLPLLYKCIKRSIKVNIILERRQK